MTENRFFPFCWRDGEDPSVLFSSLKKTSWEMWLLSFFSRSEPTSSILYTFVTLPLQTSLMLQERERECTMWMASIQRTLFVILELRASSLLITCFWTSTRFHPSTPMIRFLRIRGCFKTTRMCCCCQFSIHQGECRRWWKWWRIMRNCILRWVFERVEWS